MTGKPACKQRGPTRRWKKSCTMHQCMQVAISVRGWSLLLLSGYPSWFAILTDSSSVVAVEHRLLPIQPDNREESCRTRFKIISFDSWERVEPSRFFLRETFSLSLSLVLPFCFENKSIACVEELIFTIDRLLTGWRRALARMNELDFLCRSFCVTRTISKSL